MFKVEKITELNASPLNIRKLDRIYQTVVELVLLLTDSESVYDDKLNKVKLSKKTTDKTRLMIELSEDDQQIGFIRVVYLKSGKVQLSAISRSRDAVH